MKRYYPIGRIKGIPITLHWSFLFWLCWILLEGLLSGTEGVTLLRTLQLLLGAFLCVLLHELGHTLIATRLGVPVRKIVLVPLAGISLLTQPLKERWQLVLFHLAGPLVNLLIAGGLLLLETVHFPTRLEEVQLLPTSLPQSLFLLHAGLGLISLLPAFPLDGGLLLRDLLSSPLGSRRATRLVSVLSYGAGIALMGWGAVIVGYLPILLGMVLFLSGQAEKVSSHRLLWLEGYQVKDAMDRDYLCLPLATTVAEAVEQFVSASRPAYVLVMDGSTVAGIVSPSQLLKLHRVSAKPLQLQHIMDSPVEVWPALASLAEVCTWWQQDTEAVYPVMEKGQVVGFLRGQILEKLITAASESDSLKRLLS